jgi:hypothetical protein
MQSNMSFKTKGPHHENETRQRRSSPRLVIFVKLRFLGRGLRKQLGSCELSGWRGSKKERDDSLYVEYKDTTRRRDRRELA